MQADEYRKVLQSVVSVLQAMAPSEQAGPICSLIDPILARLEHTLPAFLSSPSSRSDADRELILVQLGLLKGCAKGLAEPEEEIVILDGPDTPSEERRKAEQLAGLPQIVGLRERLASVMSMAIACGGLDSDIAMVSSRSSLSFVRRLTSTQATTDVLRECTTGELPTAVSLDPFTTLLSVISTASSDRSRASIWFSLATSLVVSTRRAKGGELHGSDGEAFVGCVRQCTVIASAILGSEQQLKEEPDVMQAFLHLCVAVSLKARSASFFELIKKQITHHFVHVFDVLRNELETITIIAVRSLVVEERVALQAALGLLVRRHHLPPQRSVD